MGVQHGHHPDVIAGSLCGASELVRLVRALIASCQKARRATVFGHRLRCQYWWSGHADRLAAKYCFSQDLWRSNRFDSQLYPVDALGAAGCYIIAALGSTVDYSASGCAAEPLQIPQAGAWRSEEARVLVIFFLTAMAWITLREPFGGWSQWLNVPSANYAAVALTSVILMFILPNGQGGKLLDWESASTIHWGVLLLFAGGIAIAKAFAVTGISTAIGESLSGVTRLSIIVLIAVVALTVTFLTEITSNTATTTLLMPILAAASLGAGFDPALLMLPAALSASCAFMLPVATAPNAIVFGTGEITVEQMVREGFILNLIGVAVITAVVYFWLG